MRPRESGFSGRRTTRRTVTIPATRPGHRGRPKGTSGAEAGRRRRRVGGRFVAVLSLLFWKPAAAVPWAPPSTEAPWRTPLCERPPPPRTVTTASCRRDSLLCPVGRPCWRRSLSKPHPFPGPFSPCTSLFPHHKGFFPKGRLSFSPRTLTANPWLQRGSSLGRGGRPCKKPPKPPAPPPPPAPAGIFRIRTAQPQLRFDWRADRAWTRSQRGKECCAVLHCSVRTVTVSLRLWVSTDPTVHTQGGFQRRDSFCRQLTCLDCRPQPQLQPRHSHGRTAPTAPRGWLAEPAAEAASSTRSSLVAATATLRLTEANRKKRKKADSAGAAAAKN